MRTRKLGGSDLEITTIGFGAWAIGGGDWSHGWGAQDDDDSVAAILRALELGINWIDTAPVYGLGRSEEVVARALAEYGHRYELTVATKCGLRWGSRRAARPTLKAQSVRQEVEASLRRLKVEVIDLYQIYWPNPDRDIEEAWGVMPELVKEGKIRHAGVSNFSVEQMERAAAIFPVTSLQPPYSMVQRHIEEGILPHCREQEFGVVAYSPMQAGLLTGAFSHERLEALEQGDWRRGAAAFQEPVFSKALELVDRLKPLARGWGYTMAQLALAWVLAQPGVTAAIAGSRSPMQVEETTQAGDWVLEGEQLGEVDKVIEEVAVPNPKALH